MNKYNSKNKFYYINDYISAKWLKESKKWEISVPYYPGCWNNIRDTEYSTGIYKSAKACAMYFTNIIYVSAEG